MESLPAPVSLDAEWGSFTAAVRVEGDEVTVLHEFHSKSFREPPEEYDSFRTFVRALNKAYGGRIVLISQ